MDRESLNLSLQIQTFATLRTVLHNQAKIFERLGICPSYGDALELCNTLVAQQITEVIEHIQDRELKEQVEKEIRKILRS